MDIQKQIQIRERATGHSVFGPSSIERTMLCPASFIETLRSPIEPESLAAAHGSKCHGVIAKCLAVHWDKGNWKAVAVYRSLPEDDQFLVRDCMDFAIPLMRGAVDVAIENDVSLAPWNLEEIYGTSDLTIFHPQKVYTIDWKFGGSPVYVDENPQLGCYMAGSVGYPVPDTYDGLHIAIGQPVLDYFESYQFTPATLLDLTLRIRKAIDKALSPNPDYIPGDKQCMFCPAKMYCRARMKYNLQNAQDTFSALAIIQKQEPQVRVSELIGVLEKLKAVEKYASDIRKFFHNEILFGRPIPGYKLVYGRSSRKFTNPQAAALWLIQHGNVPARKAYKSEPVSVAQAEKLNKSLKKDPDFIALYTKLDGKPQLVSEDDPRPAVKPMSPEEAFKEIADLETEE